MHTDKDIETAIDVTIEEMAKIPARLATIKAPV
jgi:hypothetical protein